MYILESIMVLARLTRSSLFVSLSIMSLLNLWQHRATGHILQRPRWDHYLNRSSRQSLTTMEFPGGYPTYNSSQTVKQSFRQIASEGTFTTNGKAVMN